MMTISNISLMSKYVFVVTLFMHNLVVSLKAKLRIYYIYI